MAYNEYLDSWWGIKLDYVFTYTMLWIAIVNGMGQAFLSANISEVREWAARPLDISSLVEIAASVYAIANLIVCNSKIWER